MILRCLAQSHSEGQAVLYAPKRRAKFGRLIGVVVACLLGVSAAQAQERFISIATGGVAGVYFPAGGAICELLNRERAENRIRCAAEPSGGSVANINGIRSGRFEFGIAQSDWQFHAYNGSSRFYSAGPYNNLRAVFSLHSEPFTVVARADAGIENLQDLLGKRVNIGNPGSGQRATMEVIMEEMSWTDGDFAQVSQMNASEQSQALCDGLFDAMVYVVGHPSSSINEATSACDSVLVNVSGREISNLVRRSGYYREATIPGGMYCENEEDVATFGVGATLVTSSDVPADVVYELVSAVFDNLEEFKGLHPAFAALDPVQMANDGLSAPLHIGAARYFREKQLIQ